MDTRGSKHMDWVEARKIVKRNPIFWFAPLTHRRFALKRCGGALCVLLCCCLNTQVIEEINTHTSLDNYSKHLARLCRRKEDLLPTTLPVALERKRKKFGPVFHPLEIRSLTEITMQTCSFYVVIVGRLKNPNGIRGEADCYPIVDDKSGNVWLVDTHDPISSASS